MAQKLILAKLELRHQVEIKLAKALRDSGYEIIGITYYKLPEDIKENFDETYSIVEHQPFEHKNLVYKISVLLIKLLIKSPVLYSKFRTRKKNLIIGVAEPNWFIAWLFWLLGRKTTKVYFPYDIRYFRYEHYRGKTSILFEKFEEIAEKLCFKKCDAIIHKGPENEFDYLPIRFNALGKPSLQYLSFCHDNFIVPLNKKQRANKDIHLVFVGGIHHKKFGYMSLIKIFRTIVEQELYLHVYAINYNQLVNDEEYQKLLNNKYFVLHKPIWSKELQEEISKYDWGLDINYHDPAVMKKLWDKTCFSNRITTYLEAGIPIIVNRELEFISEIIKKYNIGFIFEDLKNLSKEIETKNYPELIDNIEVARREFSMEKTIRKFREFLDNI